MIIPAVLITIFAYLVGSINFAVVFSKFFIKGDIREHGSGNAGTTNMLRVGGFLPGLLTFLGDVVKGFVACFVGKIGFRYFADTASQEWAVYGALICGVACMIGHIFPIYFQFKGGKGIATSVGIFAVCCPLAIAIGLGVFALGVLLTRIVSLSSIAATITVVTLTIVWHSDSASFWPQAILALIMGVLVLIKHTENVKRLIKGTEKKITLGGKK